eukprot:TRINITY_DN9771_c0_g1_i2.p1 TRINITY_DN9771_c0_g1~~TRINITY_DN9771_c0_g1_i2.p1  ORF type:complete len:263 (+),score=49.82 TRINITY_DN9771_c0_g1_i2:35-823(+)
MACRGAGRGKYLACAFLLYFLFSLYDLWLIVPDSVSMTTPHTHPSCPPPYTLAVGDVSGPGSVDTKTHRIRNITSCSSLCTSTFSCRSFEFSHLHSSCCLNLEYFPTSGPWADAVFCQAPLAPGEYVNPVLRNNHPDPGVLALPSGGGYVAVTTSNYALRIKGHSAFPISFSPDLVNWERRGWVFPRGSWPSWAYVDMWAPEIHFVNGIFTVYFTARKKNTKKLSVGVASSLEPLNPFGPYEDLGHPLIEHEVQQLHSLLEI